MGEPFEVGGVVVALIEVFMVYVEVLVAWGEGDGYEAVDVVGFMDSIAAEDDPVVAVFAFGTMALAEPAAKNGEYLSFVGYGVDALVSLDWLVVHILTI